MPLLILLVDADRTSLRRTEELLTEGGYLVASTASFSQAKRLLGSVSPDLLVSAIRLEAYNGLHLAARSRIDHPNLPVILTHPNEDPLLEAETRRLGAEFVVAPAENPQFLHSVRQILANQPPPGLAIRRWPRKRVRGVVEASVSPVAAVRILDISYGGVRLAFRSQQELPTVFEVTLPTGETLTAHKVWTGRSPVSDEFWCGAEVATPPATLEDSWRAFIESVN
jgi:CheY-like chemotaxis protein